MDVRRLGTQDSDLGARAIRLLKAPDGYPVPSAEYLAAFVSRSDNVLIVASEGGESVGYLVAYLLDRLDRNQQMMFLYEIQVAESHRRRGVGKRMITELKAVCRAQDVMKMWVQPAAPILPRLACMRAPVRRLFPPVTKSHIRILARASCRNRFAS